MPTYIYKREDGTTFEIQQSIKEDALEKCPETGQAVKRVITGGGGVVYKGDGFYVTDYKNNGSNGNGTAESTTQSETSTASSTN
jgi:putative FmdB family regulatory protein